MWTKYQFFLAGLMLVTGAINTLSTAWADKSKAPGCTSLGEKYGNTDRSFDHPFLQSVGMFIGEMSCLLFFKIVFTIWQRKRAYGGDTSPGLDALVDGNQEFHPVVFWPAALCDMIGTSMMYIGLNMTTASSFQMLRGAVVVFTALLSVALLQRNIKNHMWLGVLFVVAGLVVVGLGDFIDAGNGDANQDQNRVITGDLIIIMAQIITALQMVYEEKFVSKYNIAPLQAVGWEGFFGFSTLSLLLIPMYFINVGDSGTFSKDPYGRLENALDAFCQIGNSGIILVAQLGNIISIAFFNFSGISVTRELSATTRMVLDSMRTVVVWAVSVAVGWQNFNAIQIPGFLLLALGTAVYNGLLNKPVRNLIRKYHQASSVKILSEQ